MTYLHIAWCMCCSYGMLASVSTVGSSVMAKYLNDIVPRMLESLRSQEGVQVRCMPMCIEITIIYATHT